MATPLLPLRSVEARFTTKSGDLFNGMAQRFKEKRNKNGRIIRIGRTVPFTLEQFREWLRDRLGGENGVVKCRYCAEHLSIDTLVLDHDVPVSQGGSLDLDNLNLICAMDNQIKGGMCGDSYELLLNWSALNLRPACRSDMLHRLSIAVKLAAQQRWELVKKAKQKQQQQAAAPAEYDDF